MNNPDKIFWDKIVHAEDFVDDIADRLDDNKNIFLNSSDEIPWYATFRNSIENIMNEKVGEKYEIIPKVESKEIFLFEDEKKISENLLDDNKFFDERTSCEYMEKDNFATFFAKNAFIHNQNNKNFYIWLELYSEKSLENWVNFIFEYKNERDKNNKNIVFIISYNSNYNVNDKIKSLFEYFSLKDYLTWYDCYVFFTIISNFKSININVYFKLYLAELLTNIIRDNINGKYIELCIECLKDYNAFIRDPTEKIKSVFGEYPIEDNIIRDAIYYSQIRVIYPMLDKYRLYFTRQYEKILNKILKTDRDWLEQSKEKYEEIPQKANDFQFGPLKKVIDKYGSSKFKIDDIKDFKGACLTARNKLSHIENLDFNLLKSVMNIFMKKFSNL